MVRQSDLNKPLPPGYTTGAFGIVPPGALSFSDWYQQIGMKANLDSQGGASSAYARYLQSLLPKPTGPVPYASQAGIPPAIPPPNNIAQQPSPGQRLSTPPSLPQVLQRQNRPAPMPTPGQPPRLLSSGSGLPRFQRKY